MLNDRNREKRLLQTLRYAARHEMTVRFERDPEYPDNPVVSIKGDRPQVMTVNTLALYKAKKVNKR